MPYIRQENREQLDLLLKSLFDIVHQLSVGDLNYIISQILNRYIKSKPITYTLLNSMIGVLECAKIELYNRLVTPYENTKLKENGPVYY